MGCGPGGAGQGDGHYPGGDVLGELLSKHTPRGWMGREAQCPNPDESLGAPWPALKEYGFPSFEAYSLYGQLKWLEAQSIFC